MMDTLCLFLKALCECKLLGVENIVCNDDWSNFFVSVLWIYKNHLQVTIGIFTLDCKKASSNYLKLGPSSMPPSQIAAFGTPTSDAYQRPSSDSSGDNDNIPFNQLPGTYNNATHPIPTMLMY